MNRESNKEIIETREKLRAKYHEWNHSEKRGKEHLSNDSQLEELEQLKEDIEKEIEQLQKIQGCCENLIEESQKERREIPA